jgi:glioma pathogenesis-related protein 2
MARPPTELEKFCHECLLKHNALRVEHNSKPLIRDSQLDSSAQEWANQLLHMDVLRNSLLSTKGRVGESISLRKSSSQQPDMTGSEVVEQWAKDMDNYNFETGEGSAGNFTQMVWNSTTHVGFGKARGNGKCVVVAHYRNPGNIKGLYVENVFPPSVQVPKGKRESQIYLSQCRQSKQKTVYERYQDDCQRIYTLRKEIVDYVDKDGNVTEKIHEIRVEGDEEEIRRFFEEKERTDEISEKEFTEHIQKLTEEERMFLINKRDFAKAMVSAHNHFRSMHGTFPLKHNRELTEMAHKWASHLSTQKNLTNSHFYYRGSSLGENIAARTVVNGSADFKPYDVVAHWYSESKNYSYTTERADVRGVGNFTQIVWRATQMMGAAKAVSLLPTGGTRVVVVALYYPPGNVLGGFIVNVPPGGNPQM